MRRDMSKAFSLCPWILLAVQRVEGRGRGARLNEGSLAVTLDDARAHRATRSLVNPGPKHTSSVVVNTPCTDTVALARLFSVPRMDTHVQVQVVPASHHALSRDPRHAKVYRCWRLAGSSEGSAGSTEKASCFTIHSNGQPAAATAAADEGYLVPALSIVSTSRTPFLCMLCQLPLPSCPYTHGGGSPGSLASLAHMYLRCMRRQDQERVRVAQRGHAHRADRIDLLCTRTKARQNI